MSTKSVLEAEVDRLTELNQKLSDANLDYSIQVSSLKQSNQYLAGVADRYRADLEATQLRHVQDILGLTQKAMNAMEEIAVKANHHTALAVERARTDTLAQCFDRALQTAAGNVGE